MSERPEEAIRKLVELADRSTREIPDPDLRRAAFHAVMTHLLERRGIGGVASVITPLIAQEAPGREKPRSRPTLKGPSAWVAALIDEDFFEKPKLIGDVVKRLGEVGHTLLSKDVSYPLARFCELRRLRRTKTGKDNRGKIVWSYSKY